MPSSLGPVRVCLPLLSLKQPVLIVVPPSEGINLAFARLLLQRGCSVLIGDLALRPEAEKLLSEYKSPAPGSSSAPAALFQRTDVTSWPQISALMGRAEKEFPQVDIVVPGAGLFEPAASNFWEAPKTATNPTTRSRDDANAERGSYLTLDVNLAHPIRMSQLAIGYWTRHKMPGTLLHVSSCAGHMAGIGTPIYFATKHGLHGFVRSLGGLRDELGIRVSAVAPGSVKTPLWSDDPDKKAMQGEEDISMEPEEVAEVMLELCENPKYGDGTILESLKDGTRVVPLFDNPAPTSDRGLAVSGYNQMQKDLYQKLKTEGLKV